MKNIMKQCGVGFFALSLFVMGCTQEKPFETVLKDDDTQSLKSMLLGESPIVEDTLNGKNQKVVSSQIADSDWIYLPSTVNVSRTTTSARPFMMGQEKRVRLQFTKNALKVLEVEKDARFTGNSANFKPVLSIPVTHIDYQCAKDSYGKCTNREEENNDVRWDKKGYFQMDVTAMSQQEINFLPEQWGNLFRPCLQETGSELVDFKIEDGVMNFQIEKSFQAALVCKWNEIRELQDIFDLTFVVRSHYSFVKLDKLATPGYKKVKYSSADEGNFGYFTTRTHKLAVDHRDLQSGEDFMFSRWMPGKEIVFHMDEAFNKPENAGIKQASLKAFESINQSLAKANTSTRVVLKNPVAGMDPGDLRNSMIVLVEDALAINLLGYGPSATNPATGEIIHARTVMYPGVMKKYIHRTYDEFVDKKLKEMVAKDAESQFGSSQVSAAEEMLHFGEASLSATKSKNQDLKTYAERLIDDHGHTHTGKVLERTLAQSSPSFSVPTETLKNYATNPHLERVYFKEELDRLMAEGRLEEARALFLAKNNMFSADLFNFAGAMGGAIDDLIDELGTPQASIPKKWAQLTEAEQKKAIEVLLPYVWVPTLIHEVGHNLGLRHNFSGSEDKDNFYTPEEMKELGFEGKEFKYSSIMDYAGGELDELRVMGKYDVAALRYGYAQEVELTDGNFVSVSELNANPSLKMKPYGYCTDEHVGANPNCNRFDMGTNMVEIADHLISQYKKTYGRTNFRKGRRVFSLLDDPSYVGRREFTFRGLRLIFERYEMVKNRFNLPDNHEAWKTVPFLAELKAATLKTAGFYMDVLTTPDILCAVSAKANPFQILAVLPIRNISFSGAVSCFDQANINLGEAYMVVGQGGKSFQSRKDPRIANPNADQVDVRGTWVDKMLAMKYLFGRKMHSSIFDKYTQNFLQIAEVKPVLLTVLKDVMLDEATGLVELETIFGQTLPVNLKHKMFDIDESSKSVGKNSHVIQKPMHPVMDRIFTLPGEATFMQFELVDTIKRLVPSRVDRATSRELMHSIKVLPYPSNGSEVNDYFVTIIGHEDYFVDKDSDVSMQILVNLETVRALSAVPREILELIVALLEGKAEKSEENMKKLAPFEKLLSNKVANQKITLDEIKKFLAEGFQKADYYEYMIEEMAGM